MPRKICRATLTCSGHSSLVVAVKFGKIVDADEARAGMTSSAMVDYIATPMRYVAAMSWGHVRLIHPTHPVEIKP